MCRYLYVTLLYRSLDITAYPEVMVVQGRDIPGEEKRHDVEQMVSGRDIDGLTEALQDSDPDLRRRAALALGELGEWRAVDPLIRVLADPEQDVREAAANALVMVGTPAVEPLIDLLERPGAASVHRAPGEGLTQVDLLGGPEGIPPGKRTLEHEGGMVQHDAFGGPADLRKAGGRRALEEEEGLAQHDAFGGPADLRKAGGRRALEEEEEGIAQHDLYGGPEGIPPEKRALPHRVLAQHDLFAGPEGIKEHKALFPGVRGAGVVEEIPTGMKPGLRRAYAAVILGEIADPRAEDILTRSLSDKDPAVRRAAEDGLVRFREKRGEAVPVPPASR